MIVCDFCEKPSFLVKKMVEHKNKVNVIHVCDECVNVLLDTIKEVCPKKEGEQ